jgi:hypothetical protein
VCEILPHLGFQCSAPNKSCKFSPGDRVRLSKAKRTFKKGYLPNWTEELLMVVKCIETRPPVYLVKEDHGEIRMGNVESSFHKSPKTIHCPCHSVPFARLTFQTATPHLCRSCLKIQLLKDSGYPSHLTKY